MNKIHAVRFIPHQPVVATQRTGFDGWNIEQTALHHHLMQIFQQPLHIDALIHRVGILKHQIRHIYFLVCYFPHTELTVITRRSTKSERMASILYSRSLPGLAPHQTRSQKVMTGVMICVVLSVIFFRNHVFFIHLNWRYSYASSCSDGELETEWQQSNGY